MVWWGIGVEFCTFLGGVEGVVSGLGMWKTSQVGPGRASILYALSRKIYIVHHVLRFTFHALRVSQGVAL
jgi:hypothetical protein